MTRTLKGRGGHWIAAAVACVLVVAPGTGLVAQQTVQIDGAGATFPEPIYQKWFSEYNKLQPEVQINYQPIGSGAGIHQLTNQRVFFGATDSPMRNDQELATPGRVMHLPTVLGAVVPIYNVPGLMAPLKFTGPLLADIFLGKITRWNDAAIVAVNGGVMLPNLSITVVHRSEGSGTTFIWVDYLSKVSPEWKNRVGAAASVAWPVGLGGPGNDGVAGLVKETPGTIGYVELIYATRNKIAYGAVQNMDGVFVTASVASVTAAAAAAASVMPAHFKVSITNAPGKDVYPISSFTWMLFYESSKDKQMAAAMVEFMKWALGPGQKFAPELGYAPLPRAVVQMELKALKKIQSQ